MKKLTFIFVLFVLVTSCRKTSTCTCKTKDGWGEESTLTSNKGDIEEFEAECRATQVQEKDGSLSPCKVN